MSFANTNTWLKLTIVEAYDYNVFRLIFHTTIKTNIDNTVTVTFTITTHFPYR